MKVGGQRHAPAALPPGMARYPLYRKLGWGPGQVRMGKENIAPTGTRWQDRPTRSESLYRLSYLGRPSRVMSPEYAIVQDDFSTGTLFTTLFPNSNRQADVSSYKSATLRRFGCSTSFICFMILSGERKNFFHINNKLYEDVFYSPYFCTEFEVGFTPLKAPD